MAERASWVEGANEPHGFGLNHLPYGAFVDHGTTKLCVRIGEFALDLEVCDRHDLLHRLSAEIRRACCEPTLHALLALGAAAWGQLRSKLMDVLATDERASECLLPLAELDLKLPIHPRGYTDFYASEHHARRVGEIFRPGNPMLPNYRHLPIAYNGRASTIVQSGTKIIRPRGQLREGVFGVTAALDYELELAYVVGAGNKPGAPISVDDAGAQLFGVTLLNDWSARDIQAWEYQPLGPFLGKSFATSVSHWITPMAALEPFMVAPSEVHETLPYLREEHPKQPGLALRVSLSTAGSRAEGLGAFPLSASSPRDLFWTPAQMVAHHTSNGCRLEPGDLLATGTISGPELASAGCLLELTRNGAEPLTLPNGERRAWLRDGDEVTLSGRCERAGFAPITLGKCVGRVAPALV